MQALRDHDCRGIPRADRDLGGRRALVLHPAHAPLGSPGGAAHPNDRHPDRRRLAERGPVRHRTAAGRLLTAPRRRGAPFVRRSIARLSIPFREPFVTSGGVVTARELLLLRLEDDDGAAGYGEAAPFEPYDGVRLEEAAAALRSGAAQSPNGSPPPAGGAPEMARAD